jgi:hypothetical protein
MVTAGRADRLAIIIGGVVRQAVEDARANGVVVLNAASPEGRLAVEWITSALGVAQVWCVTAEACAAAALDTARFGAARFLPEPEFERAVGRVLGARVGALLASPANKTALLLGGSRPPEPLLPLGDLYASQVAMLAGEWTAPAEVRRLAAAAGGVETLDRVLEDVLERRSTAEAALRPLPAQVGCAVLGALEAGRFAHRGLGLVPKLGARTLGIDYFA